MSMVGQGGKFESRTWYRVQATAGAFPDCATTPTVVGFNAVSKALRVSGHPVFGCAWNNNFSTAFSGWMLYLVIWWWEMKRPSEVLLNCLLKDEEQVLPLGRATYSTCTWYRRDDLNTYFDLKMTCDGHSINNCGLLIPAKFGVN